MVWKFKKGSVYREGKNWYVKYLGDCVLPLGHKGMLFKNKNGIEMCLPKSFKFHFYLTEVKNARIMD